ncbi:protein AF1q-like [Cavia porcellus]|uniref:protein AF1q-like n=1 Tax=Cavia porcellus TaxID=10141 RepID=UPI000C8777BB|nr:protein AF1q-like [Cavia porcellus]
MPILELDLPELEGLDLSSTPTYRTKDSSTGRKTSQETRAEQEKNPEGNILKYSTFNFWSTPLPASTHLN